MRKPLRKVFYFILFYFFACLQLIAATKVYVLLFEAFGRKEACMPPWRFGLQPELFGS